MPEKGAGLRYACRVSALRSSARCCASCAWLGLGLGLGWRRREAVTRGAAMVGAATAAEMEVAARAVVMAVVAKEAGSVHEWESWVRWAGRSSGLLGERGCRARG